MARQGGSRMKSTGIVRPVDGLGRIVLPIELRKTLDIKKDDSVEIFVDGSNIVLRKYESTCVFCKSVEDVKNFKGKNVCPKCAKELSSF